MRSPDEKLLAKALKEYEAGIFNGYPYIIMTVRAETLAIMAKRCGWQGNEPLRSWSRRHLRA